MSPGPAPERAPGFGFPKSERVCKKTTFEYLFEHGQSYQAGVLKFFFTLELPSALATAPLGMAVAVPKRGQFKRAALRNLMKRRIREAYRLNRNPLRDRAASQGRHIAFLVRFNPPKPVTYRAVAHAMRKGLAHLDRLLPPDSQTRNEHIE